MTSVAGHVFNVDFPPQFQSWDSVDPAELFHAPTIRKTCQDLLSSTSRTKPKASLSLFCGQIAIAKEKIFASKFCLVACM